MVYESVRDVRRAVLQMRDPNDSELNDSDVEASQVSEHSQATTNTLQNSDRNAFKYAFLLLYPFGSIQAPWQVVFVLKKSFRCKHHFVEF